MCMCVRVCVCVYMCINIYFLAWFFPLGNKRDDKEENETKSHKYGFREAVSFQHGIRCRKQDILG